MRAFENRRVDTDDEKAPKVKPTTKADSGPQEVPTGSFDVARVSAKPKVLFQFGGTKGVNDEQQGMNGTNHPQP